MVLVAKDIVEPDFLSMPGETSALDAAKRMKDQHHGFVIVVSKEGKPQGMVTEWDFLGKVLAENRDPAAVKLTEIMSPNLFTVKASEGIDNVAKLMADRGIRRVLVTENEKIIGAITAKTILRRFEEYIDKVSAQIARLQSPMFGY
jgi:CBS domain-containing protein